MGEEAGHGVGAGPGGILGQFTWTTKRVWDGAPLPTLYPMSWGDMGKERGCLSPSTLTLTAGSSGVKPRGRTLSLGKRVWGCQVSASMAPLITAPAFTDPQATAMAGGGELNRVIKDLQSKCASLSLASMSPAWHISPWPCQVPHRTQPIGHGGCHCY